MSICIAMVNAHKVEQGPRVCPRLMVVLTQTLFVWAVAFSYWITKVSIFYGPRVRPRLMVVFNPNSVCLGSCIFLVGSQG